MPHYLDINTIAFTVINYPMSYIEFFGVLFNLACVILVARKKVITWPIGIVGSVMFIVLFFCISHSSSLLSSALSSYPTVASHTPRIPSRVSVT